MSDYIILNVLEEVVSNDISFVIYRYRRFILFPFFSVFSIIQPQTSRVSVPRNGNKKPCRKWAYFTEH